MKQKILLLVAVILLSITGVFAQSGTTGPLTWSLNTGTLTISGEGAMPNYEGWGEAPWFDHRNYIYTLIIEPGVTRIGNYAFFACVNISSVTIPSSVTNIGDVAFYACNSLASITLPYGVTTIKSLAFHCCRGLVSIALPNSVITIEDYVFDGCESLPSITIPSSVTTIGNAIFKECVSLISIDVESENNHYSSENGILFNKDKSALICYPAKKTGDFYAIPSSVTNIALFAFAYCEGLTLITLPESVIDIDLQAFRDCKNLTWITNFNPVPITINETVFWGVNKYACILEVPIGSVDAYKSTAIWKDFKVLAEPHVVSVSVNNNEYGTVSGGGMYGLNTTATVKATAKSGYKFVNWTINGTEISTENPYSFTVTEDVELVANFEEKVGIEPIENDIVKIYPNPTNGQLTIDNGVAGQARNDVTIENAEIIDLMGKCIFQLSTFNSQLSTQIDISHLPTGTYFVRLQTDKGLITKKIVKK